MKDLKRYISEGVLDVDNNIDDLDLSKIGFESIFKAKSVEEAQHIIDVMRLMCESASTQITQTNSRGNYTIPVNAKYMIIEKEPCDTHIFIYFGKEYIHNMEVFISIQSWGSNRNSIGCNYGKTRESDRYLAYILPPVLENSYDDFIKKHKIRLR